MIKKLHAVLLTLLLASPLFFSFFPEANRFEIIRQTAPLLVFAVGVLFWLFVRGWKDAQKPTSKPLLLLLVAFVFWTALSFFASPIQQFGFAEVFMLLLCALVYLPFSQEKSWNSKLSWSLALTLIAASAIGVYAYLTTDHARFFGFFYDPLIKADAWPNAYADYFLMSFPFLLLAFTRSGKGWPLKLLFVAFTLAGFVLSASRGAYLAVFPALGFFALAFFWSHRPSLKKLAHSAGALLLVAVLTLAFTKGITTLKNQRYEAVDLGDRLSFSETEGGNSFSERLEFFEGALKLIQENPLLGTGPTTFRFMYTRYQQGFLALSDHPHNLWLKLASERGIPAALLLLTFGLTLFAYTHPFRKRPPEEQLFSLAAWTALVALLAHHMIDYNLNFATNALTFWFILGGLASLAPAQKTRLAPLALGILTVLVALSGLKLAYDEWTFSKLGTVEEFQNFDPILPAYEWYGKMDGSGELKLAALQKQLEANPADAGAWTLLGKHYEDSLSWEEARLAYESAIELNPKNTFLPYLGLARILTWQGDAAALESLALQLEPLFEEYQGLYDLNLHYTRSSDEIFTVKELKVLLSE